MSIQSGAKRLQRRKREVSMRHKLRWVGAFTRICNWPGGCDKKSYQWKRCNEHRFTASVAAVLSKLTKDGQIERVRRGWYKAIGDCRCGHTWNEHDQPEDKAEWEASPHPCLTCGCDSFQMKSEEGQPAG